MECSILHDGIQVWLWLIAPGFTTIVPLETASGSVVIMFTSVASGSVSGSQLKVRTSAMGIERPS